MRRIDQLLDTYAISHQNSINKSIHWICIPLILFSLIGLIRLLPYPAVFPPYFNWASVILLLALAYYFKLSRSLAFSFLVIGCLALWGNEKLQTYCQEIQISTAYVLVGIFVIAWIGQFIGHAIEGKRPSFFQDLQFLLIGPAWLVHFIFRKWRIPY